MQEATERGHGVTSEHGLWGGSDLGSSQTPVVSLLGDLEWGM